MKKVIIAILALVLIFSIYLPIPASAQTINGSIETVDGYRILNLWGTSYQMGYAHGYLLGADILPVIVSRVEDTYGTSTYNSNINWIKQHIQVAFPEFVDELNGMVDGMVASGNGYIQALKRNVIPADLLLLHLELEEVFCSSFGVWGSTDYGGTIIARNFDWELDYGPYQIMFVRQPDIGPETVSFGFPGWVGIQAGMNQYGVTVTANAGYDTTPQAAKYCPVTITHREILEKTTPDNYLAEPLSIVNSVEGYAPVNIQIGTSYTGQSNPVYYIEDSTKNVIRYAVSGQNYIMATNFMVALGANANDQDSVSRYNTIKNSLQNLESTGDHLVSSDEAWGVLDAVSRATLMSVVFRPNDLSFDFTFSDGSQSATQEQPVTLQWADLFPNHASVSPPTVNTPPVALNDTYNTNEDTALNVAAPGVLGNDSDVDGNALTAVLVSGPAHGTLTLNAGGSFTYTPGLNYNGADSFSYEASDGQAYSNVATVAITINPVNDAPVAVSNTYSTTQGTTLNVAAPGVLGNDSDVDNDPLTAVRVAGPSNGTLTLNADGSFTYSPNSSFTGTDSFTYRAYDGQAYSNTVAVTITVTSSAATFGLNNGNATLNESRNYLNAMRFQNTAGSGNLTKLEILFNDTTPNGKVRLGVYADNNGKPGARLLDAGEVTVVNGWVSISGLNLKVTQNTYYWLVFNLQSANVVTYQSGRPSRSHYRVSSTYGTLPSQFSSYGVGYDSNQFVMRATVKIGS